MNSKGLKAMKEEKQPMSVEQCMYCGEEIFWVESAKDPDILLPLNVMPPSEERARELGVYTRDGRFHRHPAPGSGGWLYHPPVCPVRSRAQKRVRESSREKTVEALLGPEPPRGRVSPIADTLNEIRGALELLKNDVHRLLEQQRSLDGISRTSSTHS
jgi:hypothetical protein